MTFFWNIKLNTLFNKYSKLKAELFSIEKRIREAEKKAESDYVQKIRARKEKLDREIDSIGEEIGEKRKEIESINEQVIAHKKQKEILSKKIDVADQNRAVDNDNDSVKFEVVQSWLSR